MKRRTSVAPHSATVRGGPIAGDFDVVVVGAGILGTSIAAELAQTSASVCVLEAATDVAEGSSKGNAGIVSSYYAPPGTLEAELLFESHSQWEDICGRLHVPFRRSGALTVAISNEQFAKLPAMLEAVKAAGVKAEILPADEVLRLEPLVTREARGALSLPDEAIVDPMRLTWANAELAAQNGAKIWLNAPVIGFARDQNRIVAVHTARGTVRAGHVVNAAGLMAGRVSAVAGGDTIDIWPRKGQYWIIDREFGRQISQPILPVPGESTRGIQVVPTTNGSVLLGPDASDGSDFTDTSTDLESLDRIRASAARLVPAVTDAPVIKSYAANRAAAEVTVRFGFDQTIENLFHVGNRSTGVSCAPATATRAVAALAERGLDSTRRRDAVRELSQPRRLLLDAPEGLAEIDRRYLQVVCVCEQVTAAEIAYALECKVPAESVEGVRKRTRATAGRCQGSVCMAGVALLCATHTNTMPGSVRLNEARGTLGVGDE